MTEVLLESAFQALWLEAEKSVLSLRDLEPICRKYDIGPEIILNELLVRLSRGYLANSLTYEFCDDFINGISSAIFDVGMMGDFPQPALDLYYAFDAGEWDRKSGPEDISPAELYTRPNVTEILQRIEEAGE